MNKLILTALVLGLFVSCGKDNDLDSSQQNPITSQTSGINGLTTGQPISSVQFQQELNTMRSRGCLEVLQVKSVNRRRGGRNCSATVTETYRMSGYSYYSNRSQRTVDFRNGNCSDLGVRNTTGYGSFDQYSWQYNSQTYLGNYNGRRALVVLSNDYNGSFNSQFSNRTVITQSVGFGGFGGGCY